MRERDVFTYAVPLNRDVGEVGEHVVQFLHRGVVFHCAKPAEA
jgi:hypothetical protein